MVILCDSKDKKNEHILEEFDKQKIEYKTKSLKTGDYSFLIKACPELGFQYDTYFTDELCIERKNSLSELAGNLAVLYSRRINIQHRLVYENFDEEVTVGDVKYEGTVKIIRMWTPALGRLEKE